MLRFNASNVPQLSPFSYKQFDILGDGTETELVVDLTKAPLGMEFIGDKFPHTVFVNRADGIEGLVVEATTSEGKLNFRFSKPLPKNKIASVQISFWYE
jgi:hypothetical protein